MSLRCGCLGLCRASSKSYSARQVEGPHHVEPVVDRVFEPGPDSVVDALDVERVGCDPDRWESFVVDDVSWHAIAADGFESVRVVIARVALAEIFPAGKQLRWTPCVLGEREEAGVVGERRLQVVCRIEFRDRSREKGRQDAVHSIAADHVERERASVEVMDVPADPCHICDEPLPWL